MSKILSHFVIKLSLIINERPIVMPMYYFNYDFSSTESECSWGENDNLTCVHVRVCLCRMIQVERESAELPSDEIESRVNSGSMDGLNVTLRPRALPTSATAQSLASSSSPPNSGHSTPKHHARNTSHHLGIMTLVREHTHVLSDICTHTAICWSSWSTKIVRPLL